MKRRHAQPILAQRWRSLAAAAVLLVLSGAVILVWLRIDAEVRRANALADEANLRGDAVAVLVGDVRVLREQIKGKGGTPAVPDPARTVENLPGRAEVPVPIPAPSGPPGRKGEKGDPGAGATSVPGPSGAKGGPRATVTDPPGPTGPPGPAGADGLQGEPGANGKDGRDGADGKNGADGQTCPAGYSLRPPEGDPNALICRRDGAPQPDAPSPSAGALGLPAERRRVA
ncbi:collagen-like protein [Streptomyces alboflavus]|uniref:collagen-like protein n=1 Tax=Streptomyces alboflavus TaxID=67267 RepID=UPI000F657373|nr:collagen-like protein [Streptomyces alboflavus]